MNVSYGSFDCPVACYGPKLHACSKSGVTGKAAGRADGGEVVLGLSGEQTDACTGSLAILDLMYISDSAPCHHGRTAKQLHVEACTGAK
jgi:hypothetical protein